MKKYHLVRRADAKLSRTLIFYAVGILVSLTIGAIILGDDPKYGDDPSAWWYADRRRQEDRRRFDRIGTQGEDADTRHDRSREPGLLHLPGGPEEEE